MSSIDGDFSVGLSSSASLETTSPISVTACSPSNLNEFTQFRSNDAIESGVSNLSSPSTTLNSSSTVQTNSPKSERIARKCVVCLDLAFGNHYGCIVCNGCKGFFRRSVWSKRRYACRFGNDCEVKKDNRNVCRACRLKKCFTMGMRPEAVQLEHDRDRYGGLSTPSTSSNQWVDSMRDGLRKRNFKDSSVQTNITMINNLQNEPVKPTPCRLNVASNSLVPASTHDVEQLLLDELISVENEIWSLRDTENIIKELKPFGQLNVKFDVAYSNPELVSRRYPLDFSGTKILDAVHFIDGWRRGFTWYIDYTRLLKPFARLSYNDQICLSKRRLVNVSWLSHLFHSYLNGHDGIALANGHYHPHSTDPRSCEANPVMSIFSDPMMPMVYEDILRPFRSRKFDFNEFVLMKCLIMFRDEFFLTKAGLKTVREIREQYSKILYNYVLRKCGNDVLEAINRFTEILGFIGPVLHLTARMNERIQMSICFNILDIDPLLSDCHHPSLACAF
ncbi:Nuclear hormone receptor family member nhr-4 [Aphelenchoides besseyi]|nr:Nuclear hormone receptor family member nhr-4 [Aphelenchoides besseyi]